MMRSITSFARRVTRDSASQRKWLMLRLVMLLFTAMTTSATWADTATFNNFTSENFKTQTGTNVKYSLSASNVSFDSKNSGIQISKGGSLTITPLNEVSITKVTFECTGAKSNFFTITPAASSSNTGSTTQVFNFNSVSSEITFTRNEDNPTITSITVEYTTSGVEMNAVFSSPSVTAEVGGTAKWPTLTVKAGETTLKEDTDYSVTYESTNNDIADKTEKTISTKTAGTATVTATITSLKPTEYTAPKTAPTFSVTIADTKAPEFTLTTPSSDTDVAVNTTIVLTASEDVSIVGTNITATLNSTSNSTSITGVLGDDNRTITFTPGALTNGTTYTLILHENQVQDAAGNKNEEKTVTFTTIAAEPETHETIGGFKSGAEPEEKTPLSGTSFSLYNKGGRNDNNMKIKDGYFIVEPQAGYTITKIEVTWRSDKAPSSASGLTVTNGKATSATEIEPTDGTQAVTVAPNPTGSDWQYTAITVYYTTLPVPTLTLSSTSVDGKVGNNATMPSVTAKNSSDEDITSSLTFTYASNDDAIARVSEDKSKIEFVSAGTTAITVTSHDATGTYADATATINVSVTDKTVLSGFAWSKESDVLDKNGISSYTAPTLTKPAELPAGAVITYNSTNINIATVNNETGVITLVSDGSVSGTTVISATWAGNEDYAETTATYTLTVQAPQPKVTLPEETEFPRNKVITLGFENFTIEECNSNADPYLVCFRTDETTINKSKISANIDNGWWKFSRKDGLYPYLSGIALTGEAGSTITVQVAIFKLSQTYDETTGKVKTVTIGDQVGGTISKTYNLTEGSVPAAPKYSPNNTNSGLVELAGTTPSDVSNYIHYTTDESMFVKGDPNGVIYGKFSSNNVYTAQECLNELNVVPATGSQGVFSTVTFSKENKLRFLSGYQVVNGIISDDITKAPGYYYIAPRTPVIINAVPSYQHIEVSVPENTQENNFNFTQPGVKYLYNVTDAEGNVSQSEVTEVAWLNTITYSSSNENVATVDASGNVTLTGNTGTAVITIKSGKTDTYDVATGSYSIEVTNANVAVPPTISPESKNYSTTFNATVTAPANTATAQYVTRYVVYKEGETELTPSTTEGTEVSGGESASITIEAPKNKEEKCIYHVKAITYQIDAEDNPIASNVSSITEVKYTYKYVDVPEPVLTPGKLGKENSYDFTKDDTNFKEDPSYTKMGGYLQISASLEGGTPGTVVYYTINSASNVVTTADKKYDGLNKIKLDQSAIIRAIAVDPDGNKSDVVTYRYNYNGAHFTKPYFVVTGEGAGEYHEYSTVDINTSSKITLKTTANDGVKYTLYYTLDGSEPTGRANAYSDPFSLVASATVKVMAVGDEGSVSEVASCKFNITTKGQLWIANEATCTGGKLGMNEGKSEAIINQTTDPTNGVEYITATFGGINNADDVTKTTWKDSPNGANDAPNEGAKVDGVGVYDLSTSTDIFDEVSAAIVHENEALPTTHERTFKLPAKGTYMKFEPERDGNLYIYVFQNGGVVYDRKISTTDYFSRHFITMRPVYLVDEAGITQPIDQEKTKSNGILDSHWKDYVSGGFSEKGETIDGKTQTMFTSEQQEKIFEIYKTHLSGTGAEAGVTGIKPFNIYDAQHRENAEAVFGAGPADSYAYATVSAASVRYVFPVKAGKTYFFYSDRSKIAIRGFRFIPTTAAGGTLDRQDVEIDEAADNTEALTKAVNANKTAKVTLKRNFKADTWTSIVLPFSVSNAMLKDVFGEDTKVIHFNRIDKDKNILYQMKHYHQMLVAGTPAIIKPSKAVTNPVFDGVQVTKTDVDDVIGDETYKTVGSYNNGTPIKQWSFYINNTGVWKQLSAEGKTQIGTRAWIEGASAQMAIQVDGGFDDGETTGIYEITVDDDNNIGSRTNANGRIYNLNGQCVGNENTDINSLANGIYMINGKKIVVNNK